MRATVWREWAFAVLLYAPALVPLVLHYQPAQGDPRIPTGFVQYDQPYYMANARQYLDGDTDGLRYALPFSADPDPEPIYFQPQTALLAALWWLTDMDPGLLFDLFGLVFGVLCVHAALRVLRAVLRVQRVPVLIAVVFIWGGGLLYLTGTIYGLLHGEDCQLAWIRAFRFDPANGFWFMSLGRNLIFPLEAYYHFLFFTLILLMLRQRFAWALFVAALLALSHPFTGVATLVMLLGWSLYTLRPKASMRTPWWFALGTGVLLVLLLLEHRILLPQNAEHKILMVQWVQAWTVPWLSAVSAYALVAIPVLMALFGLGAARWPLAPERGLLMVWVLVWLGLEHHELFMTAVQPAHFTRGYVWTGLFLLGAPTMLHWSTQIRRSGMRASAIALVVVALLLDNTLWLTQRSIEFHRGGGDAINVFPDQQAIIDRLAHEPGALVVADDPMMGYLTLVYTHHRAYYSHTSNTPWSDARYLRLQDYFNGKITDPILRQEVLVIVHEQDRPFAFSARGERLCSRDGLSLYRMPAQP